MEVLTSIIGNYGWKLQEDASTHLDHPPDHHLALKTDCEKCTV